MSASNAPPTRLKQWQALALTFLRSIRARIIFPYVILTLVVAFAGIYIVTSLVQKSLDERLQNQLADAAGVASDRVALFEEKQLDRLRGLLFLADAYEAMRDGDYVTLQRLLVPSISNDSIRRTIVIDRDGKVVLDFYLPPGSASPQPGGSLTNRNLLTQDLVPLVQRALSGDDAYGGYYVDLLTIEDQTYLATAGPFRLSRMESEADSELQGVIIVAEPLNDLLNDIKEATVVLRVSLYGSDGQVIGTTVKDVPLQELAISPSFFQSVVNDSTRLPQEEWVVLGRPIRFAYFVFQLRYQTRGVMSIGLDSGHVARDRDTSRVQLAAIFSLAVLFVVGIGYAVSRRIIVPIMQLVQTTRAVALGDLDKRTGIRSDDEIGRLAATFDQMTESLAQRTADLERLLREKREEHSRVRAILSSIAEGVLWEDQNHQITTMNPAADELLTLLAEQFRSMEPVREIDTAGDARRFEIGGRVISVESSPVTMPEGTQHGNVMVMRDITHETEVAHLKDEFISQISHELRTPLTSIKGYSDLLLKAVGGGPNDQQRSFLQTINRHADGLVEMITQLLDFIQLEAGNLGLRLEPMSIESVVQAVAEAEKEAFDNKNIKFSVQINGAIPRIMGDERRLHWALSNLVENACKYTQEGGQVTLALSASESAVTIQVKDTGVGISPEDQPHLFTRFYRVSLERTMDVRGQGVGLYVAKAIVEGHGGEIGLVSALGQGSTFTVTLPLDSGAQVQKSDEKVYTDLGDLLL